MNKEDHGHIMIVDDEDIVRLLLCDMIKSFGYTVTAFSDPMKAIDFYKNNYESIDLVILDMTMPGLSGRETFFLLKKINHDIKSIILSGFGLNEDVNQMLKDGCLLHIKKPVNVTDLKNAVNGILKQDSSPDTFCELDVFRNNLDISEVDIDRALSYLGGNTDLYIKMLNKFITNYSDAGSKMHELAVKLNYEELFVFSHSVKSLAASLGFSKLQSISENIENACQKKESVIISENTDLFYAEMLSLSSKIKTFIIDRDKNQDPKEISTNDADYKAVAKYLDELIEYAKGARPKQIANIFNDKLKNITLNEFGYLDKEALLKKIRLYDFEGIIHCAEKIKDQLNKGGSNEKI